MNFSRIKIAELARLVSGQSLCSGEFRVHELLNPVLSLPPNIIAMGRSYDNFLHIKTSVFYMLSPV